jgi:hypothetical protein
MMAAVGTSSRNSSSCFGPISTFNDVTPGSVAAWSIETGDEPDLDGVDPYLENDRNRRRSSLGRPHCEDTAQRDDHGDVAAGEIGRQCRKSTVLVFRPPVFDSHVLVLDIAGFLQPLLEGSQTESVGLPRPTAEIPDHRN